MKKEQFELQIHKTESKITTNNQLYIYFNEFLSENYRYYHRLTLDTKSPCKDVCCLIVLCIPLLPFYLVWVHIPVYIRGDVMISNPLISPYRNNKCIFILFIIINIVALAVCMYRIQDEYYANWPIAVHLGFIIYGLSFFFYVIIIAKNIDEYLEMNAKDLPKSSKAIRFDQKNNEYYLESYKLIMSLKTKEIELETTIETKINGTVDDYFQISMYAQPETQDQETGTIHPAKHVCILTFHGIQIEYIECDIKYGIKELALKMEEFKKSIIQKIKLKFNTAEFK